MKRDNYFPSYADMLRGVIKMEMIHYHQHTFLIFQPYQTILKINFVSIIQYKRLVFPVCMTTLIKLNFKEHESSAAQHIQCPRPHNRHDNCGGADDDNNDNDGDDE